MKSKKSGSAEDFAAISSLCSQLGIPPYSSLTIAFYAAGRFKFRVETLPLPLYSGEDIPVDAVSGVWRYLDHTRQTKEYVIGRDARRVRSTVHAHGPFMIFDPHNLVHLTQFMQNCMALHAGKLAA